MFIINDREDICINMDYISSFNIHTNGLSILVCFDNPTRRDIKIGEYSSREKSERVFNDLIRAIDSGQSFYKCLRDDDPVLNTSLRGSSLAKKAYAKTNGKTK